MYTKIKEKIKAMSTDTLLLMYSVVSLAILSFIFFNKPVQADEILYNFKSPSFSGVNSSSHYLTIENQEATRREAVKEEIEAYKDELAREASNTTLARFIRNLESRIYAQLSRQMVEQLFGETPQKQGKLTLEGNTIEYIVETDTITLTITDEAGGSTNITVPIGDFTF
jgi:hypothetical protein|tara:strand:+ start:844 stop:1350 length:507 start_codon:yes stop_codon:yes gene_type:complete